MFKKLNKKGFTLAELLVVVAIIGVLVAISIPIFTGQLEKARQATDAANIRAAYAEAAVKSLENDGTAQSVDTQAVMQSATWDNAVYGTTYIGNLKITDITKTKGTAETVTMNANGTVTIDPKA